MDDLNFDELNMEISMDAINDALKELSMKNPGALFYFNLGRLVGRMDITNQLMKIIKHDVTDFYSHLKGKKK